jgi:hypothetical protein
MKRHTQDTFDALLGKHLTKEQAHKKDSLPCPDENIVVAYSEGSLPLNLKEEFETHASSCPRCQQELALLLKVEEGPEFASSPPLPSGSSSGNWLSSIVVGGFESFQNLGLRPVLSILVVTLISGFLGYELLLQHQLDRSPSPRLAGPISPNGPPVKQGSDSAQTFGPEREQFGQEISAPQAADEKTAAISSRHSSNKTSTPTNSPAAAPPATLPGTSKETNERTALRDNRAAEARRDEADTMATANSDLEAHRKERQTAEPSLLPTAIPSRAESSDQSSDPKDATIVPNQKPSPYASYRAVGQASRNAQTVAGSTSSPKIQGAHEEAKKDTDRLKMAKSAGRPVEDAPQGQDKLEGARSNALSVLESSSGDQFTRLNVADKTFELRNNTWTDASIDENQKVTPVVVYKNSPRYREQMKSLSAYQTVLSRPEDCLLKYEGKIYLLKNTP